MSNTRQALNVENEWAFLNSELIENKPTTAPFSDKVVKAREILLKLQVLLSAYEEESAEEQKHLYAEKYLHAKHAYLQLAYR